MINAIIHKWARSRLIQRSPFDWQEYRALRKEVELYVQEARALERYTLVALGASWAWLVVNKVAICLPWLIPPLLIVAVGVRGVGVHLYLGNLRSYLAKIEDYFGIEGWEHNQPHRPIALTTLVLG